MQCQGDQHCEIQEGKPACVPNPPSYNEHVNNATNFCMNFLRGRYLLDSVSKERDMLQTQVGLLRDAEKSFKDQIEQLQKSNASSSTDLAALKKEVTELRQRVQFK